MLRNTKPLQTSWQVSAKPLLSRGLRLMASQNRLSQSGFSNEVVHQGGSRDSFKTRENALENAYFRQKEIENLKHLQKKLEAQRRHLEEVDKHIEEMLSDRSKHHQESS